MTLPNHQILEICRGVAEDKNYDLRNMQNIKGFFDDVQKLAAKFIDSIHFNHLLRQKESEKLENLFQEEGTPQELPKEGEDRETDYEEEEERESEKISEDEEENIKLEKYSEFEGAKEKEYEAEEDKS